MSLALTVLVAESDQRLGEVLVAGLQKEGFELFLAHDGAGALAMYDLLRPDVVLVDVELPGVAGLDVCVELRRRSRVPIVLMSANGSEADPVTGLELGADDFVADPLRVRELAARTRAVVRRAAPVEPARVALPEDVMAVGDVCLDKARLGVTVGGRPVDVPLAHFRLLEVLVKKAGHVVTREELASVAGGDGSSRPRTVSNQLGRLRVLLGLTPSGKERISVVRGRGYVFELPEEDPAPIARRSGGESVVETPWRRPHADADETDADATDANETRGCPLCAECAAAERGEDPWAVVRLTTGYVRLNPVQYYPGATLFVGKACVAELHSLSDPIRAAHLAEMAQVAQALFTTFSAKTLSYEAPSHVEGHLHWWLTPRPANDPHPTDAIWQNPDFLRCYWSGTSPSERDHSKEREAAKRSLRDALEHQNLTIERSYVS
jgi:two-component system response regulator RegX3